MEAVLILIIFGLVVYIISLEQKERADDARRWWDRIRRKSD